MFGRRTFILSAAALAASAGFAQNISSFADDETAFRVALRHSPEFAVTLTLEHSGPKPLSLTYPSSQDFDIAIWDSRGQVVRAWSADKAFLPVVRQIEFAGKKTWVVPMSLDGLAPGRYLVDAWLTTEEGPVFRATLPLTVERP
jgi:hypothetical protein